MSNFELNIFKALMIIRTSPPLKKISQIRVVRQGKRSLRCQIRETVSFQEESAKYSTLFFKIVVVKIPRISVFRSFTYFLFLSWSFGIVLWEVATIGMY